MHGETLDRDSYADSYTSEGLYWGYYPLGIPSTDDYIMTIGYGKRGTADFEDNME